MKKNNQKKRMRTAIPFLAILVIFVLFKILQPERFGTAHSINVLIQQTLMQSIIGCGLYFLNEMGIFDMTLGANMIISAMIACKMSEIMGIPGLILGGILTGMLIAFIGSLFMTRLKINPMIISVGLIIIYEAISTMLTQGAYALQIAPEYRVFGKTPGNIIISIGGTGNICFCRKIYEIRIVYQCNWSQSEYCLQYGNQCNEIQKLCIPVCRCMCRNYGNCKSLLFKFYGCSFRT